MLLKLSKHISSCLERALNAEERALHATDATSRSDHELLAQSWRHLARSYQFVESLEHFLSETAQNKDAVPPEMLEIENERPTQPESKPIIRRPRVKHMTTFQDRLAKSAEEARAEA